MLSEAAVSELPQQRIEVRAQRLRREVSNLEWIYCGKPKNSPNGYVPRRKLTGYTIYQGYTRFSGEKGMPNTRSLMTAVLCGPGLVVEMLPQIKALGCKVPDHETIDQVAVVAFSSQVDTLS